MSGELRDRVAGVLYGLLVGDALGAPLVGLKGKAARDLMGSRVEMREPVGSRWRPRGLHGAVGQEALALCEALLSTDDHGDVGPAFQRSLLALVEAGATDAGRHGLLRGVAPPLAATLRRWREGDVVGPAPAEDDAARAAVRAGAAVVAGHAVPVEVLQRVVAAAVTTTSASPLAATSARAVAEAVRAALVGDALPPIPADGAVAAPVARALEIAAGASSFDDALESAVLGGGDADVVGALAGQLAGARFGRKAIPVRWMDALLARGTLEDRIAALLGEAARGAAFAPGFSLVELERGWMALVDEGAAYPRPAAEGARGPDDPFEGTSGEFTGSVNETMKIDLAAVRRELAVDAPLLAKDFAGSYQDTVKIDRHDLAAALEKELPPRPRSPFEVLRVLKGDITRQEVDVIVNAANTSLLGGGGVDGAIHRRGGPTILEECQAIRQAQGGCKTGSAVVTGAGHLPARYVVHAVGPRWRDGEHGEDELLASAYRTSLALAQEQGARTVAFPSLSTGAYRFPLLRAARIAVRTLVEVCREHAGAFDEVLIVAFDDETHEAFTAALRDLPRQEGAGGGP